MKSLVSIRFVATALAALGMLGASASYARSDVEFSVTVQSPGVVTHRAPIYVQPAPIYVQPAPVYVRPAPVFVQPAPLQIYPVYGHRNGPYGDRDRDGVPNIYDRHDGHGRHHHGHPHHKHADWDRDGVPNRYDRYPTNPYYR